MHAKSAKTPSRTVRYLLYADRTLQRISLKRISVKARTARPSRPVRPKNSTRARTSRHLHFPWPTTRRAAVAALACVIAAIALIGVRQRSGDEIARAEAQPPAQVPSEPKAPAAALANTQRPEPTVAKVAPKESRQTIAVESTAAPEPLPSVSHAAVAEPIKNPGTAPSSAATTTSAVATITGCLEFNEGAFRLTDTSGGDAPKSRSWKAGFLKKRTTSIDLVDTSQTLRLPAYVGRRVVATGTLINREMQLRSLQPIANSCS